MLLITYDLHQATADDYTAVEDEILSFGQAAHIEEFVWLVDTLNTPSACRDALKRVMDDARYFVVALKQNWASSKMDPNYARWLKDPQRHW